MSSTAKDVRGNVTTPETDDRWRAPAGGTVGEEGEEEDNDNEVRVIPPDGGWGWMVVFSSFLIHIIADGIVYSFGIFFVEFIDYFDASE